MPGSNMALATLGTFILWLGWFGFNGASQLAMGSNGDVSDISRIFANTNLAACRWRGCSDDPDPDHVQEGRRHHGAQRRTGRPRLDHC
jgi:hypothetical protein